MGSRKRNKKKKQRPAPVVEPARPRRFVPIAAVVIIVGVVAGTMYIAWPEPEPQATKNRAQGAPAAPASASDSASASPVAAKTSEAAPPAGETAPAAPPAVAKADADASAAKPDFAVLKGRWQRPDGGYVVDIQSVDPGGKMTAAYLNPRQINVSKAEASRDGSAVKVFLELRDENYPGSTYTLTYDPRNDQLHGIYYQAVQQQRFEVFFVRMH